jgi:hypothetical protein
MKSSIFCLFFLFAVAASPVAAQMTSVVNSLADDADSHPWDDPDTPDVDESMDGICKDEGGRCTLRAALEEASNRDEPAMVTFSVAGKITLNTVSSAFSPPDGSTINGGGNVYISGSGPTGFDFLMGLGNNTRIEGMEFRFAYVGITVGGDQNVIGGSDPSKACEVVGMGGPGILVAGNLNIIKGNFIGIMPVSQLADANQFGIFVLGANNLIGGGVPGERNIISGNTVAGISIAGDTTDGGGTGNIIIGNYIGTNLAGTAAVPNGFGIQVVDGKGHFIGGGTLAERNVISGNTYSGVEIGTVPFDIHVQRNYIGTDPSGTALVPNRDGVTLAPGSTSCVVEHNLIKGNTGMGVLISGGAGQLASMKHRVSGNTISGNEGNGVLITGNATENVIGSSLTQTHDPNEILGNGAPILLGTGGITVIANGQGTPERNTFRQNDIALNISSGILFDVGNTVQDGIVPPVLYTYEPDPGGEYYVTGRHDRPGAVIDVYAAEQHSPSGAQGRRWLGSWNVGADSTFIVPLGAACGCDLIVATATDAAGNTSEFSTALVPANSPLSINFSINNGWNMLSVPLNVADPSLGALFPAATGSAFSYTNSSYQPTTTLQRGVGYWLRFPGASSPTVSGTAPGPESLAVSAGWNLVGSFSTAIPVDSVGSVPPGLVLSSFFGFSNAYAPADTLKPGGAYWVKTAGAGSLVPASGSAAARTRLLEATPPRQAVTRPR